MRMEEGAQQALAHHTVRAMRARGPSSGNYANSNRHKARLRSLVTYSKQKAAAGSNRHKFGGTLYPRAGSLSKENGGNFLTDLPPLLYICKVSEETGGPLPASYRLGYRGTGLVGAGIGNGFKETFDLSDHIFVLRMFAGVSLPGIFAFPQLGKYCGRTARPHTEEAA